MKKKNSSIQFNFNNNKFCHGFTLIEVLVALAIIAIALTAIIRASSLNIENSIYIQNKNIAMIVANNILSEAKLGLVSPSTHQTTTLLNTQLYWSLIKTKTPDPHVARLTVNISTSATASPLFTAWGFSHE